MDRKWHWTPNTSGMFINLQFLMNKPSSVVHVSNPWFLTMIPKMVENVFVGATTGALTRMIRDAMQWNRCREFKMFLLCTEQPITAIILVKAVWSILRLFWNLFLLLHLPRYLALITAFIANKKTRFPHHCLHQSSTMNMVLKTSCLR